MASIQQAAKWMQEGKRVKRPGWRNSAMGTPNNVTLEIFLFVHEPFGETRMRMIPYISDLLADDWEIAQ